jgi:hypothetical protein
MSERGSNGSLTPGSAVKLFHPLGPFGLSVDPLLGSEA